MCDCAKIKFKMEDLWPTQLADTKESSLSYSNLLTDAMEGHSRGKGFRVEPLYKEKRRTCISNLQIPRLPPSDLIKLVTTLRISMDLGNWL